MKEKFSRRMISIVAGTMLAVAFCGAAHAITTEQYAILSELVYYPNGDSNMSNATTLPGFTRIDKTYDSTTGFQAAAYEDSSGKNVVISFAGTQGNIDDIVADIGLGGSEFGLAEKNVMAAVGATLPFTEQKAAEELAKAGAYVLRPNPVLVAKIGLALKYFVKIVDANNGKGISLTGHSLGGYIAQAVATRTGALAVVFNAPGAGDFAGDKKATIVDHIRKYDIVGIFGRHIGSTYVYPQVKFEPLNIKERYIVRNHDVIQFRKDLGSGMRPVN